jgi:hypothetical protein
MEGQHPVSLLDSPDLTALSDEELAALAMRGLHAQGEVARRAMARHATADGVLTVPMQPNRADAATIRDYLIALLAKVWSEGEGFNSKRPFGNSSWHTEIYEALVRAGLIEGRFEDGYLEDYDDVTAQRLVGDAIEALT